MKILVKIGTLKFEDGNFSRGDIVEVTPERFALFDQNDVEAIVEEAPPKTVSFRKRTIKPIATELSTPEAESTVETPESSTA